MYESTGFSGLTKAQTMIVSYWQSKCREGCLPSRLDIDPGALRSQLSAISIVELEPDGGVRFRIAGSQVRAIFGREMRGRRLDEFSDKVSDMWSLGLAAVLDRHAPVGGIIERVNDRHAWLRLPLQADNGCLILCHDELLSKTPVKGDNTRQSGSVSNSRTVLAA